ncbi:hypothetical protein NDU88_005460 [Pleurodeles waltl]|uniref:Uncharacterized protein n=1 Tax=Pleurodeles waltl TaxID=8319 RepID=A0AAV7PJM7_PLEWA|nr:hypothetical protein NDU88_005460 [Pleurodeles waltl]
MACASLSCSGKKFKHKSLSGRLARGSPIYEVGQVPGFSEEYAVSVECGSCSSHRLLRGTGKSGRQRVGGRGSGQSGRSAVRRVSRLGPRVAYVHVHYNVGIVIEEGLLPEEGQAGILPDPLEESTWDVPIKLAAPILSVEPILILDSDEEVILPVKTGMSGVAFDAQLQQKQKVFHPG